MGRHGKGTTVVRSAYGIFYRSIPLNLVRTSYSGSAFTSLSVDITNPKSFDDPYAGYAPGNPFPFVPPALSSLSTYKFVTPVVTSVLDPKSATDTRSNGTSPWSGRSALIWASRSPTWETIQSAFWPHGRPMGRCTAPEPRWLIRNRAASTRNRCLGCGLALG